MTDKEQSEKTPSVFARGCFLAFFGVLVFVSVLLTLGYTKVIVTDLYHAIRLSNQGISTSAEVLVSKNTFVRYSHTSYTEYEHFIQYNNIRKKIILDSKYPVGSNISIIYDKNESALVWQGNSNMSILNLYILNSDAHGDKFSLIYLHGGFIFIIWLTYTISNMWILNIRLLLNEIKQ